MKKTIGIVAMVLLWICHCYSQQLTITSEDSSETLVGASISDSSGKGLVTDLNGTIQVPKDWLGKAVTVNYLGYDDMAVVLPASMDEYPFTLSLKEKGVLLNTATITSSRYEQRLSEATISLEVLRPEKLGEFQPITLDQALKRVSGVQIIDDQANIRGGSGWSFGAGNRVMLLIDDMPAMQADAGLIQWEDIPSQNIDQVEILKGSSSTLYGSAAMNGVINVRTAWPGNEPRTKISIDQLVYQQPKDPVKRFNPNVGLRTTLSALHSHRFNKFDLVINGFFSYQDSSYTKAQDVYGHDLRLNTKMRYRVNDKFNFGLNSIVTTGETYDFLFWFNPTSGAYKPFPGIRTFGSNTRIIVDPFLNFIPNENTVHRLKLRNYYVDNERNNGQTTQSNQIFGEYQIDKRFLADGVNATGGIVGSRVTTKADLFDNNDIALNNRAAYLQLENSFGDRLKLSGGVRYEYNKIQLEQEVDGISPDDALLSDGKWIGRIGGSYEINDVTFFRASYGQGYRFPTITERFVSTSVSGFTIFPNARLRPETGSTIELGGKLGVNQGGLQSYFDLAVFESNYDDMLEFTFIELDGEFGFQSQNIGNIRIRGLEVSWNGLFSIGDINSSMTVGYTYIDPKYRDFTKQIQDGLSTDENVLKYRTKHQFNANWTGNYESWNMGLAYRRVSHMEAIDAALETFAGIGSYRDRNDTGYYVFDLQMGRQLGASTLNLVVQNLTNKEYTERPGKLTLPRSFGLKWDIVL